MKSSSVLIFSLNSLNPSAIYVLSAKSPRIIYESSIWNALNVIPYDCESNSFVFILFSLAIQ